VPAVQGLPAPGPDELIQIASLEPWAQAAFPGYKTLNRIQSRIFQTAYYRCDVTLAGLLVGSEAGHCAILWLSSLRPNQHHIFP
jgi:activating signal cointegrator complex subunit 3